MKYLKKNWHRAALIIIMALAGFLSFYKIGNEGYGNQYYAAAVKSMLTSWHNFFFASFDAGGYVTVDKPALGLWLQAISVLIFGFHGWSLILPESISTVVSVALIYHLVRKYSGRVAGLLAALILALTPILIAVSRTNNLDASLLTVLLLATWAMATAVEKGNFQFLLLSVGLVGLGFNIKMLEAFMVLPALYFVYLLTPSIALGKKILHLFGATIVLLVVSLVWAVIVDMTPADQRPYVGSSKNNSVLELAVGYNGIQRITGNRGDGGMNGPGGGIPRAGAGNLGDGPTGGTYAGNGMQNGQRPQNFRNSGGRNFQGGNNRPDMQSPPNDGAFSNERAGPSNGDMPGRFPRQMEDGTGFQGRPGGPDSMGGPGGGGGPGGAGENGPKGVFRIFNEKLAGQISWFLPIALFGILILCLKAFQPGKKRKTSLIQWVLWSAWILPMLVYFSIGGFYHRYYLSMLAPGIAALSGIGIVEMWKAYRERGWKWCILPVALVVTAGVQGLILWNYTEWRSVLVPTVCGIALWSALILVLIKLWKKEHLVKMMACTVAAGIAALLTAPAIWSYTPIMYGSQANLPSAGPELKEGGGGLGRGGRPGGTPGRDGFSGNRQGENGGTSPLVQFLLSKKQGEKFLVAVGDANTAAPIILQTGEAVMAVGGFSGSDNILTVERLSEMVEAGELRYFMAGGRGGQQSGINAWVQEHGKAVTIEGSNAGTLYDLVPEKE